MPWSWNFRRRGIDFHALVFILVLDFLIVNQRFVKWWRSIGQLPHFVKNLHKSVYYCWIFDVMGEDVVEHLVTPGIQGHEFAFI